MPDIPEGAATPQDHAKSVKAARKAEQKAREKAEEEAREQAQQKAAREALEAEAADEPTAVEFGEHVYTVVGDPFIDLELMDLVADYSDGRRTVLGRILKRLLGREQYATFLQRHRDPETGVVSTLDAQELFGLIDRALGK